MCNMVTPFLLGKLIEITEIIRPPRRAGQYPFYPA